MVDLKMRNQFKVVAGLGDVLQAGALFKIVACFALIAVTIGSWVKVSGTGILKVGEDGVDV